MLLKSKPCQLQNVMKVLTLKYNLICSIVASLIRNSILVVCDPRGGLPVAAPGDKFYSIPEYSVDFHNEGSTIPAVNFR